MDDKLLILEDTNGDGKADKRTVFAGDLEQSHGLRVLERRGDSSPRRPNLVFLKDTNGDDKYDTKQILIGGIDSADTHHTMNSFMFDPGGALYIREGIFHRSQVETPWGPVVRQADGGVFRFEPQTFKFETYIPMNFPNPHGHVFDHWGRDIVFDATGGQPYYGPSMSTKKYYPAMESTKAPRPGQVRTRPVGGSEILSSRHFPDEMQGNLVVLNTIGFRGLLQLQDHRGRRRPEDDGSRPDHRSRPTRTSARSTRRSAPTARSTSPTGRTRSSATCSTTCATRHAITSMAASIASPMRAGRW